MANEIISYLDMCRREGVSLQRGMNFGLGSNHSVILMSVRPNAPYEDELQDSGTVLIYEGHDVPRAVGVPDPKRVDQPEFSANGSLTQLVDSWRQAGNICVLVAGEGRTERPWVNLQGVPRRADDGRFRP